MQLHEFLQVYISPVFLHASEMVIKIINLQVCDTCDDFVWMIIRQTLHLNFISRE